MVGTGSLRSAARQGSVTVGFFDGVHKGHAAVLGRTVEAAAGEGLAAVAVTFDRHPRQTLEPGKEPPLLTSLERKADLISSTGITTLLVLEFTHAFSLWSPNRFVQEILVRGLRARTAVVGSNFRFGHGAAGDVPLLRALGSAAGFTVLGVDLVEVDGRQVSSSSIREELGAGRLGWATRALGRRYVLDGTVVGGARRGAALGFPTANLAIPRGMLLPGRGVYAGTASVQGSRYTAAINVGTNPTFGEEPLHVEAHLVDFEGDLRGLPMALEFWARLRDEVRFETAAELVGQMAEDVERTRAVLAHPSPS